MKINDITEGRGPDYETNPAYKKLASIGRALMAHSETASMKGKTDDEIGMFNKMSTFGDALTRYGTTFGPKNIQDVMKDTGLDMNAIKSLMAFGEKLEAKGVKAPIADPKSEPEDDEEDYGSPTDDAIARQADARAAKRK
tara:strand:+ start:355 stop:774 length:420 start_codon:yes stop_codon:yes gene_type:complete